MTLPTNLNVDDQEPQEEVIEYTKRGTPKVKGFRGGDAAINRNGRPVRLEPVEKPTNKQLKEKELLMLLRKFRPHVAEAVIAAAKVIKNDESADQNKLKAADLILRNYHKLVIDLYANGEPQDSAEEVQKQSAPVFSLRMIEETKDKEEDN